MDRDEDSTTGQGNQSAEALAATQQVGDELPGGIRGARGTGSDFDNPSATGALDPDQPDVVNTAAGFSVGGTGVGIEPGTDAGLGLNRGNLPEETAADAYGEPGADIDFDRTED